MTPTVVALVLSAAALHATWNAVLRSGGDRLWSVTAMSLATTLIAIPLAFVLPIPSVYGWPYLGVSATLQVAYSIFLVSAYRDGELGQIYPIVRGSVPLLVTLGAFFLAHQRPSLPSLLGVVFIAFGIMSLASGKRRASAQSVALALVTGLFIASYITVDGLGVRVAGNPRAYATWIFLIYGALMPIAFIGLRGSPMAGLRSPETLKAMAGGVISLIAYGAVISALALGPIGPISALRETSVVFAVLIGRAFLGEALSARRVFACVVVAVGAVCVGY